MLVAPRALPAGGTSSLCRHIGPQNTNHGERHREMFLRKRILTQLQHDRKMILDETAPVKINAFATFGVMVAETMTGELDNLIDDVGKVRCAC